MGTKKIAVRVLDDVSEVALVEEIIEVPANLDEETLRAYLERWFLDGLTLSYEEIK